MHNPASIRRILGFPLLLAMGVVLFSTHGAFTDSLVAVTSLGGLSSNDSAVWLQLGANGTSLSASFNANSSGGVAVTGTLAGSGSLVSVVCPAASCSWASTDVAGFSSGDSVIWTSDSANGGNGPLTLAFNKSVMGAGALIQADGPGQFTAQIQAFNGNTALGTFTTTSDTNGDAVFLGVLDQTATHITSVVFSLTACSGACSDFAIDTLYLNSPGGGGPTPTATGVIPTPTATPTATTSMVAMPIQLSFGNVDASGSSKPHKVSIINKGSANALVGTVSVPAEFTIAPGTDLCSNQTVIPKKSCTVMLRFSPSAPGAASGAVSVPYNGAAPVMVGVSGNGTPVRLKKPASVAFAPVAPGSSGPSKPVTITNLSTTATVQLSAAGLSGPFTVVSDGCSNATIVPKGRCVIWLQFAPPMGSPNGAMAGNLNFGFTYGSNNGAAPVPLSGMVK